MKSAISTSIFLSTVRKNTRPLQNHFLAVSRWSKMKNLIAFSPLGMDISRGKFISWKSGHTHHANFPGKRVIYHGKSVPATALEHLRLSCTFVVDTLLNFPTLFNIILTYTNTSCVSAFRHLLVSVQDWAHKSVIFRFVFWLFHEMRPELLRVISRSLRGLS